MLLVYDKHTRPDSVIPEGKLRENVAVVGVCASCFHGVFLQVILLITDHHKVELCNYGVGTVGPVGCNRK